MKQLSLIEPLLCAVIAHIDLLRGDRFGFILWMVIALILSFIEYRRVR